MDSVVDEHGRLTAETKAELARILRERPDLLELYVDGLSTILRDAARRPSPARSARDVDEPQKCENLPEEAPALTSPGERRR